MNKPIISIIVPVYNSEKYIQRCINSIINQTFINFEAIFINDGSADSSLEILKSNKSLDNRIKIINQENSGTGEARNNGLRNALGKYILFVDSDDTIEPSMLEKMYKKASEGDCDIVACNINKVSSDGNKIKYDLHKNTDEGNLFSSILSFKISSSVWNKLYKKDLFYKNSLFFPKGLRHNEDNAIVFKIIYYAQTISFVDDYLYNWYVVENSKSNSISKERLDSISSVLNIRYDFLIEQNIYYKYELDFIRSMLALISLRIQNIINFTYDKLLILHIKNIVLNLVYFTKQNLIKGREHFPAEYFKLLNRIILLNYNSLLLNYFDNKDVSNIKKYLKPKLGLLQSIIDNLEFYNPKEIYVYGAGENFIKLKPYLSKYSILGVLDKNPNHDELIDYNIVKLEDIILNNNITIVITSVEFAFEIKSYIENFHFMVSKNEIKIIYCFDFVNL